MINHHFLYHQEVHNCILHLRKQLQIHLFQDSFFQQFRYTIQVMSSLLVEIYA